MSVRNLNANLHFVHFRHVFMTLSSVTLAVSLFMGSRIAWDEPFQQHTLY
jgi:hypothetical protein